MHDIHGNVIETYDGTSKYCDNWYIYNAYGTTKYFDDTEVLNATQKWGYCNQLYDFETGNYYMRARYYNPDTGRFISEDTHWNPSNMIYGDRAFEEDEIKYPDITASLQAGNLYGYCINNPVMYMDINGDDVLIFGASAALDAFGISIEADEFLLVDDNWNIGRYVASGAGAGFFGASATSVIGWVDVDTIYDMSEITLTVSASGGEATVISGTLNFNSEGKVIGGLAGIGVGAGSPVDFNVKPFTFSYVSGFNLKDTAKAIAKKALNVFDNLFNK